MNSLFNEVLGEKLTLIKKKVPPVFMKRNTRFRINRYDFYSFNGKEQ
jgi:hypothetical protein